MSGEKGKLESIREGIVEHKLLAVMTLYTTGFVGSSAYNWYQPNAKTSVKIFNARLQTVALTLAALAGATDAVSDYYDPKKRAKADSVTNSLYLKLKVHQQRD